MRDRHYTEVQRYEGIVFETDCPTCGEGNGWPCVTTESRVRSGFFGTFYYNDQVHKARWIAAREALMCQETPSEYDVREIEYLGRNFKRK